MKAIILAGGIGTRLWPMSRQECPKQFYKVISDEPLIKDTYKRLLRLFPAETIYFSISPSFESLVRHTFPDITDDQLLIEPEKRDTGPAMGYVAALMEKRDPEEPIVFIPSDHFIRDEELFLRSIQVGDRLVLETGKLVDIAIQPTFPSTVLGYTRIGERHKTINGIEVYHFAGHTEKPPYEVAKQYLENGSYLWHANYYMWTPRAFMEAIETYAQEIGAVLREIQMRGYGRDEELYARMPKISFDYAVTEKMNPENVLIIKGTFGWSDIGAWDTLYDHLQNESKNVTKGNCVMIETHGSLVYAPTDKLVAVLGMRDLIVVDTGDALLVCPKSRAQDVKKIVSELTKQGKQTYL